MSGDEHFEDEDEFESDDDPGPHWGADYWRADEEAERTAGLSEPDDLPRFEPEHQHGLDLGWFFRFGPKPPKKLSRKNRIRYSKIKRCLAGYGYALQRYYTNEHNFVDRRLAPAPLDPDFFSFSSVNQPWALDDLKRLDACRAGFVSSEDDGLFDMAVGRAVEALQLDYTRFLDNLRKHYAAHREPHIVLTERELRRAIFWGGTILPTFRTEMRVNGGGAARSTPVIVRDQGTMPDDMYHRLLSEGRIVRSTWGHWRVSEEAAAVIALMPTAAPEEVFDRVKRLAKDFGDPLPIPKTDPWHSPDDTAERRTLRKHMREERLARMINPNLGDPVAPWGDLYRDPRLSERQVGNQATTVRELGKKYGIDSSRVRQLLVEHGCEAARIRNTPIPIEWLRSPAGESFKGAIGAHAGTFSGRPDKHSTRRNAFRFLRSNGEDLH